MRIGIVGAGESMWSNDKVHFVKRTILKLVSTDKSDWEDLDLGFPLDEIVFVSGHSPRGGVNVWTEKLTGELERKGKSTLRKSTPGRIMNILRWKILLLDWPVRGAISHVASR